MRSRHPTRPAGALLLPFALLLAISVVAVVVADPFNPLRISRSSNGSTLLQLEAAPGSIQRVEFSTDLGGWNPIITLEIPASGFSELVQATAPETRRFYRAVNLDEGSLTGDHFDTSAGDVLIHLVDHASFVMQWNDKTIYNDPVGGAGAFSGIPTADLVLVGHRHGDHYSSSTLNSVTDDSTVIIAPQDVFDQLSTTLKARTTILANGASADVLGLSIRAVPAYNNNHLQGRDNGYVVTVGDKQIYMSGDTGDTAEMRALENIDVAFVAMNIPFTMSVDQAASAIREFGPAIVYPYHYRNQNGTFADFARLTDLIGTDLPIELRLRDWYP